MLAVSSFMTGPRYSNAASEVFCPLSDLERVGWCAGWFWVLVVVEASSLQPARAMTALIVETISWHS